MELTADERKAVVYSVRSSINLYVGYVMLKPETPQMKRRQTACRKRLGNLRTALSKILLS